jgi:hypothetical protein
MAEAKLGHRALAQAALDDYRSRRARRFAGAKANPPEDTLLAEAEAVLRAAFPPGGGSETRPDAENPKSEIRKAGG